MKNQLFLDPQEKTGHRVNCYPPVERLTGKHRVITYQHRYSWMVASWKLAPPDRESLKCNWWIAEGSVWTTSEN